MGCQNWRMAPCPDLKPSPTPKISLDWAAVGFSMVSAGTLSGFMGFRLAPCLVLLAPCLVLWDFKTDGWPPVPISNPPPRPRAPWIELRRALAWFRLAPLVLWDFGWRPVWLYGILKLTDGPLSRSQSLASPRSRAPWIELWLALAMLATLVTVPPANFVSSVVSPTVSNALLEFVPTNARTWSRTSLWSRPSAMEVSRVYHLRAVRSVWFLS